MNLNRRDLFKKIAAWWLWAALWGFWVKQVDTLYLPGSEKEPVRLMNPSEATENMISTFARSYVELHKWEMLFYDDEGKTIEKVSLPQDWDSYGEIKKQAWRDEKKRELWKKYGIEWAVDNIQVSSPHLTLKWGLPGTTMLSLTKANGLEITINDNKKRTRLQYVWEAFSDFWGKWSKIAELMSTHMVGLAGAESNFDTFPKSKVWAVGIFQLMPVNIRNTDLNPHRYSVDEVKSSLKKQVEIAKRLFESDWKNILTLARKLWLSQKYFDNDTDKLIEYLLFPLLINAYNTGFTNMSEVLRAFVKKYPTKEFIEQEYSVRYGEWFWYDLFWYISRFWLTHKGAPDYGSDSAAYFYKSMGMSKALGNSSDTWELRFGTKEVVGWVLGGLLWVSLNEYLKRKWMRTTRSTNWFQSMKNTFMTRRKVLAWLWVGTGVLGIGGYLATQVPRIFEEDVPSSENMKIDFFPRTGLPEVIAKSLYNNNTPPDGSIDKKHHALTITPWIDKFAESKSIFPAETQDWLARLGGKLDPNFSNLHYRARWIWSESLKGYDKKRVGSNNHQDYLAIHPHTEELIRHISDTLNTDLSKQFWLDPSKYRIRLIISSGARDKVYAKKYLRNASDNSSHPYGIAFDIAHRFDVVDINNKRSYMIDKKSQPEIYRKTKKVLNAIINKKQHKHGRFRWSLFAIQENNHIHVTDRLGEEKWIPPFLAWE
jgi:Family of unknown function (DUF5715)/Transglycosylase SLT domain